MAVMVVPLSTAGPAQASGQVAGTVVALPTPAAAKAPQPKTIGQSPFAVGAVKGAGLCSQVLPHLADYARQGQARVGCQTPGTAASKPATTVRTAAVAAASTGPVWCSTSGDNTWWILRFSACISNEPTTYTEYDSKTGAVMGTASLAISQDAELSATSTTWDEAIYVSITAVSGAVSTLEIGFTASCTSPCSMVQPSPWCFC